MSAGSTTPFTTKGLLDARAKTTGLLPGDLLLIAVKSATVRHIAQHPQFGKQFILKGGTLLHHVYGSNRMSIADADYTYVDTESLSVTKIYSAFKISNEGGFYLYPEQTRWPSDRDLFEGKRVPFRVVIRDLNSGEESGSMQITISIRDSERLDKPSMPLFYSDPLLNEPSFFEVEGLTLDELCAEKILGWASKGQHKHAVDLAYVQRDCQDKIDGDHIADLVRQKFTREPWRYRRADITRCEDIAPAFLDPDLLADAVEDWERVSEVDLRFTNLEKSQPADSALTSWQNIVRSLEGYWRDVLDRI